MTENERLATLWSAALRDAAGFFAAFATPSTYSTSTVGVAPLQDRGPRDFVRSIERRLELGRAVALADLSEDLSAEATAHYRHQTTVDRGRIRGKLHVPRFGALRSNGRITEFPVLQTRRSLLTPENLLVSEAIKVSLDSLGAWVRTKGSEATLARDTRSRLLWLQDSEPWHHLRSTPKPSIGSLVASMRARLVGGAIPISHPACRVADLFDVRGRPALAFEKSSAALVLAATEDPRFADRLFELLCVSWVSDALRSRASRFAVYPERIKASAGAPVVEALVGGVSVKLFFQTSKQLPPPRWKYFRRGKEVRLRALPDVVLTIGDGADERIWIVDAKNRPGARSAEIVYKMLGYCENLRIRPYLAVALTPLYEDSARHNIFRRKKGEVRLSSLPLGRGRSEADSLVGEMLSAVQRLADNDA